jgi:membrane-bound metal-dependent hydrolase YbcI (DUF457 family)
MPITPFHFGPGALLHSVAPKQVSFLSFCAANVIIDLESLYNLLHHRHPVHAFFHTCVGASLVIAVVALLFLSCRWTARRFLPPDKLHWRRLTSMQVLIGAALGAYTHVILDSVMHQDIQPLSPFSSDNPLLGIVSLGVLHTACVVLGVIGLLIIAIRRFVVASELG